MAEKTLDGFACKKEYDILYRARRKKYTQDRHKKYYEKNRKQILENQKQYRIDNLEKMREVETKRYRRDKDKRALYNKKWTSENPQRMRKIYERTYERQKHEPEYRIASSISKLIRVALKENKEGGEWRNRIGYTMTELRQRLESQFTDGMSWENYGKWHIDHIIPQSFFVFDSIDDVEFRMCWRLENLQPLWAKDNLRKGNKIKAVA